MKGGGLRAGVLLPLLAGLASCVGDAPRPSIDVPGAASSFAEDDGRGRSFSPHVAETGAASAEPDSQEEPALAAAPASSDGESFGRSAALSSPDPGSDAGVDAASTGAIALAPAVGVAPAVAASLARAFAEAAPSHGMRVVETGTDADALVLKGYLSRGGDGSTVTHVWDVYDGAGQRLHRVQGRELSDGNGMDAIAHDALARVSEWLRLRAG